MTPGVVQRPVTRRGNLKVRKVLKTLIDFQLTLMQPKSRAFSRIQADMFEESTPVDAEVKREAEVIRQVRESDDDPNPLQPTHSNQSANGDSSPVLPAVPGIEHGLEDIPEDNAMGIDLSGSSKNLFGAFSRQAVRNSYSQGKDFWNNFQETHTQPPAFLPRGSSSGISDDMNMDSPTLTAISTNTQAPEDNHHSATSRASTPQPFAPPSAVDGLRKNNKRRRDDDLDSLSMKRRAVSPGMSVQNSPIMSQSPGQREASLWGSTKASREGSVSGHGAGERSNSNGSMSSVPPNIGPRRVGMQGMTDTHDGLMKMSIE